MRGFGQISPWKLKRKMDYLRRMGKPNQEGGATARSWPTFWQVVFKLKLCRAIQHSNYY